jgi:trk system potassium uptake protein
MKIIIIGAGKVGYNLAESLEKEGNDITIIDKNPAALKESRRKFRCNVHKRKWY